MLENSIYISNDQSAITIPHSIIYNIVQGEQHILSQSHGSSCPDSGLLCLIDSGREWSRQDVLRRYIWMVILV